MDTIKIRQPNDFHHHLRDGDLLKLTGVLFFMFYLNWKLTFIVLIQVNRAQSYLLVFIS